MEKKILYFGYGLFFSGVILFGLMHVAIAIYAPHLDGWSDPPGKLAMILGEIAGWVPYVTGILFIAAGLLIIVFDMTKNSPRKSG